MNRILKYLWFHLVMLLTGWLPDLRPVLRIRGCLVRPALAGCGRNLMLCRHVYIAFPDRLQVGANVYFAYGAWIQAGGGIRIEDDVVIGPYAVLVAGDHVFEDGRYRIDRGLRAPIHLKRGCWVAAHATVTKGVTIGHGAMLAANAVATEDLPDRCVAAGVPARVIRSVGEQESVS